MCRWVSSGIVMPRNLSRKFGVFKVTLLVQLISKLNFGWRLFTTSSFQSFIIIIFAKGYGHCYYCALAGDLAYLEQGCDWLGRWFSLGQCHGGQIPSRRIVQVSTTHYLVHLGGLRTTNACFPLPISGTLMTVDLMWGPSIAVVYLTLRKCGMKSFIATHDL